MMAYGMPPPSRPAAFPVQIPQMRPPHVSNRLIRPPAHIEPPKLSVAPSGATIAVAKAASVAVPPSMGSSGAAVAGGPISAASRSKQGLEKILDTLSKMFPDVKRFVLRPFTHIRVSN